MTTTNFNMKEEMQHLTYIQVSKYRRKYNDVLRKGLTKLNIAFTEISTKYGYRVMVADSQIGAAQKFLLSISLTKPQYI